MNSLHRFLLLFTLATYVSAYFNPFNPFWDPSFDYITLRSEKIERIIEKVNSKPDSTWTAGHNFDGKYDRVSIQNLVGTAEMDPYPDEEDAKVIHHHHRIHSGALPHDVADQANVFDAREAWPSCPEIGKIRNQGKCASDWVLAPVSVIADRWCIAKNGTEHFEPSAHDPLSCCKKCGKGCRKGHPKMVYKRFVSKGLPSGGEYNSSDGCQPYEIEPCESYDQCLEGKPSKTPICKPYCYNKNFNSTYHQDLKKGAYVTHPDCAGSGAKELKSKGPLSATMVVFEDFLSYKSGIYQHVEGEKIGKLTVKLIGFNDTHVPKYWIAVNSWGPKWGENGTFRILRGQWECQIEQSLYTVRIE